MSDQIPIAPVFRSSISLSPSSGARLRLTDESELTKIVVRAGEGSAVATNLAVPFGRRRRDDEVTICGTRPDEWMVIGPVRRVRGVIDALDTSGHVSVVDLTHGRAMLRLEGQAASATLEKVCALDFGDAMTPDGAVTSASVAKVVCDIIRDDHSVASEPSYLLVFDRSYGQYMADAITDAMQEFAASVPGASGDGTLR